MLSWALQSDNDDGLQARGIGLSQLERRRHALRKTAVELLFGSESVFITFSSNTEREDFVRLVCENTLLTDQVT